MENRPLLGPSYAAPCAATTVMSLGPCVAASGARAGSEVGGVCLSGRLSVAVVRCWRCLRAYSFAVGMCAFT